MATIQADDLADLINGTLRDYEYDGVPGEQFATTIQEFVVMDMLLPDDRVTFAGGSGISRDVMTSHGSTAKNVGFFEEDVLSVEDFTASTDTPWRNTTVNWSYDVKEKAVNMGKAKIFDMIETRHVAKLMDLATLIEGKAWSCPTTTANKLDQFGFYYWLTKHVTGTSATGGGFNGGNNAVFTSGAGGLSSTTNSGWKNWTAIYTDITKPDLIKKMRRGFRKTGWKMPKNARSYFNKAANQRFFVGTDVLEGFEDIGESQNENLGRDLATMDGTMMFRGHPIYWVPYLDNDTDYPVFQVDLSCFKVGVMEGHYFRQTGPKQNSRSHDQYDTFIDITWNMYCTNKRTSAVYAKSLAYPSGIYA